MKTYDSQKIAKHSIVDDFVDDIPDEGHAQEVRILPNGFLANKNVSFDDFSDDFSYDFSDDFSPEVRNIVHKDFLKNKNVSGPFSQVVSGQESLVISNKLVVENKKPDVDNVSILDDSFDDVASEGHFQEVNNPILVSKNNNNFENLPDEDFENEEVSTPRFNTLCFKPDITYSKRDEAFNHFTKLLKAECCFGNFLKQKYWLHNAVYENVRSRPNPQRNV